jgi:hypothetical protein
MTGPNPDNGTDSVAADNTGVVTQTVTPTTEPQAPTIGQKVHAFILKAREYLTTYSYEVFLIAIVVAISSFVLLFPRTALAVGATVAAVSGWIAYFGLRNRTGSK